MGGQLGMEAEVGAPGLVDEERRAAIVRERRDGRDVRHDAHVGRLDEEDGPRVGRAVERLGDPPGRHAEGQAGRGVQVGANPDGLHAREDEAGEEGLVQMARGDHPLLRAGGRKGERLVPPGSPRSRKEGRGRRPRAPPRDGPGLPEQVAGQVQVVDAGREGEIQTEEGRRRGGARACDRAS